MKTGFDILLKDKKWYRALEGKKVAYLGHSAGVSSDLKPTIPLLLKETSISLSCLFSPQHGWYLTEQANMIPTKDTMWQGLPVYSLYQDATRNIKPDQLQQFDVLVIDLQDVGCRVYTYLTTLLYVLKSCTQYKKSVVVLDRPNPAGRMIEGSYLNPSFESFVGAWFLPMRHGMTLGEIAKAYAQIENLDLDLKVIPMQGYKINEKKEYGWPKDRTWVLSSPNMTDIECVRCYSGTVLLEGTSISEGRGTTTPLKAFGFPSMRSEDILKEMSRLKSDWMEEVWIRPFNFKPTFDKYKDQVCKGIRLYINNSQHDPTKFKPYRLISLFLKAVCKIHPDYDWKQKPPYEYEYKKWPIDILSGDSFLREWIEDPQSKVGDLEQKLIKDEKDWARQSRDFYLY